MHPWRTRLLVLAAVLTAGWSAIAVATRIAYAGRVLPGTQLAGLPLGGADRETVLRRVRAYLRRPVELRAEGLGALRVPASAAGLQLDHRATARRALQAGRQGPLAGALTTPSRWLMSRELPRAASLDAARIARTASRAARRFGRRPFDGALVVDPDTLTARAAPPRDGRAVDRPRLRQRIAAALRDGRARVVVPMLRRRAAPAAAGARVAAAAEAYLQRPIRLAGARRTATLDPATLAGVLRLVGGERPRTVRLGTDEAALDAALRDVAGRFGRPAREPRFTTAGELPALEAKGDARWRQRRARIAIEPGRPGRSLDVEATRRAVDRAVAAGRHRVRVSVRPTAPATSLAAARDVRHLIGTFTTRFAGGQPRVRNIRRIATAIDGAVIAPGAQFSLNALAGPRTRARGYVPAPSIADGELVDTVGGGVSQVATTVYNAAFFAGLRLDAHRPHSFYIDRYPPGREATLSFPEIDVRWTNDTAAPVVVRARTGATSVTVQLLGDNGGRRVTALTGPRRPADGGDFTIDVTRVIRGGGRPDQRTTMATRYDEPPDP